MARYTYDRAYEAGQLHAEILVLALPGYQGICGGAIGSTAFEVLFTEDLTPANKAALDAAIAAHIPLSAQARLHAAAKALLDGLAENEIKDRAAVLGLVDKINDIHAWIMSFKSATAAATSLANFQTRVAATGNLSQISKNDVRTYLRNKIDSGNADTST